jgi:hypothetical protein
MEERFNSQPTLLCFAGAAPIDQAGCFSFLVIALLYNSILIFNFVYEFLPAPLRPENE